MLIPTVHLSPSTTRPDPWGTQRPERFRRTLFRSERGQLHPSAPQTQGAPPCLLPAPAPAPAPTVSHLAPPLSQISQPASTPTLSPPAPHLSPLASSPPPPPLSPRMISSPLSSLRFSPWSQALSTPPSAAAPATAAPAPAPSAPAPDQ